MPSEQEQTQVARKGSRLELDDSYHCKWCGGELPEMMVDGPICGGESEDPAVELCGSCEAERVLMAVKRAEKEGDDG